MALNACIGALGVLAAHRLAATVAGRTGALLGALAVALHPALVAYTAALMTEAVVASLLLVAGGVAVVARRSDGHRSTALRWLLGAVLGVAILVRPQCVLMAPWVGALASPLLGGWRAAVRAAVGVTGVALLVVTPWT
jgi:predicted small integral membrane protein